MNKQTFRTLIREEIEKTLMEAALPARAMTLLQPVLDGIASGTIKSSEVASIIDMIRNAKAQQTPVGGKFTITNYKNGITVKKNNATKTITLTSKDSSVEPKTFKFNARYSRYINPNDGSEMNDSINAIVNKFAAGEFDK